MSTPEGAIERLDRVSPSELDERASLRRRVDEYLGDLAGLRVVEVEFADEAAADRFEPPAWFGREVTAEDPFSARSLACDGRPEERG